MKTRTLMVTAGVLAASMALGLAPPALAQVGHLAAAVPLAPAAVARAIEADQANDPASAESASFREASRLHEKVKTMRIMGWFLVVAGAVTMVAVPAAASDSSDGVGPLIVGLTVGPAVGIAGGAVLIRARTLSRREARLRREVSVSVTPSGASLRLRF